ncbi:hypothetical protein DFH09DRAFT_1104662 [Mycena vulgaris]|nr:hypothetical protein DFH09DRAFT_1104662 [Mycena vulgaris]
MVIGKGHVQQATAGNVIANRLSDNPNYSVLVLEAGGFPGLELHDDAAQYLTLGDTSSEAAAQSEDFDGFAKVTGDNGRSWDSLVPYLRKIIVLLRFVVSKFDVGFQNERLRPPSDHHNTAGQFDPAIHGLDDINTVSFAGFPSPIDDRIIETTAEPA